MAYRMVRQMYRSGLVVMSLMVMLVVAACTGTPATTSSDQPTAGTAETTAKRTVRIGWPGSPDTLNPGAGILTESYTIYDLLYDTLYELQFDGTFTLSVADSVEVSADGTVYTFHIRPGITFHDGTPLTAKDVAFSLNFYKAHEDFPFLNFYTLSFETIEATADQTVVLTLNEAIPNLESQLLALYILPEHVWSQYAEGSAAAEFENLEMIGSGPFKMQEYQQNEFVHLTANQEYFLGAPKIDEAIFQTFGNEDALVQALQTGQVDMITEMPNTAVPTLNRAEHVTLVTGAPLGPSVRDIILNQTAPEDCPTEQGGLCTGHPALLDRNVRLALAHATDKQNIIDVAMLGLADPGLTLVALGQAYWYNDQIGDYAFDTTLANQILDDGGYLDTDGDGIREMPDGSRPLTFRLQWANDIPEAPRIAELLGQSWSQVGIKTEPQAVDPDALTSICCPTFDFDIIIWGWSWGPDPNDPLGVMRTDQIPTGSSETGYANEEFDALYDQQAVELDPEKRRDLVFQMQQIVFDDIVYIVPYYQRTVQAYRNDRFTGWITDQPTVDLSNRKNLVAIEPVQ